MTRRRPALVILVIVLAAALPLLARAAEPDHSRVPGVVVDHLPARAMRYVGSPSLAILPDGTYVASHDIFGPGSRHNRTRVFASTDRGRNTLALLASDDLRHWTVRTVLLYHPDVARHGFQYPDWRFDGADLVAAIRTAYDDGLGGAHNAHDANYLTFHRFEDFRGRTMADGVLPDAAKE